MISRRSFFALLSGVGTAAATGTLAITAIAAEQPIATRLEPDVAHHPGIWTPFEIMCEVLARTVGSEAYNSWFSALEFEAHEGSVLTVSLPVRFLQKWVRSHYHRELLQSAQDAYGHLTRVEVLVRRYDWSIGHKVLSA
ncbi:DnaA N-terminal domain-containing protein [uncultured Hyphomicrobium sp.]|uniref:DnaA N-terminal domain-containing protein n=1 Tax=uncultured Hyphomicrobium sp. TaxID=194373 RepID=UPI0025F5AFA6|nr:DnaA N-terminal domain-containing protein [uncultured Hyphomicrobium sp.]